MKKYFILLFITVTIGLPLRTWASEIFGKIYYKGAPLKGAELNINNMPAKTNDLGAYSVTIEPGSYVLKIKLPDGTTRDQKVDVFPQATEKNLKLE